MLSALFLLGLYSASGFNVLDSSEIARTMLLLKRRLDSIAKVRGRIVALPAGLMDAQRVCLRLINGS